MKKITVLFLTLTLIHSLTFAQKNDNDAQDSSQKKTQNSGQGPNSEQNLTPTPTQEATPPTPGFQSLEVDERSGSTEYSKGATRVIRGDVVVVKDKNKKRPRFTYAVFDVSFSVGSKRKVGKVKIKLHQRLSPQNVNNFIALVEGEKEFTDPKTNKKVKRPYYDGLTIHRVTKNFLVQGGDPKGNGTGDPGYRMPIEKSPALTHDRPGVVSMFNAGQFFITLSPVPSLDGKHTIIGQVVDGMAVVDALSKLKTTRNDRPRKRIVIKKVTIERIY